MKEKKEKKTNKVPAPEKKAAGKKKNKKLIIALSVVLAVIVLAAAGATYAGRQITMSDTNLPNVYVGGIYVGGMTKAETRAELEKQQWDRSVSGILNVELPMGASFRVDYTRAGANLTSDRAVEAAYRYGHEGNWFENLFTYLKGLASPEDVSDADCVLNEAYITKLMDKGIAQFDKLSADKGYELDSENSLLIFLKGAGQMRLDRDALYAQTAQALMEKKTEISYVLPETEVSMPDFDALHEELAASPADAYYDKETDAIVPDVKGVEFDVDEAKSLWNGAKNGEKVQIPVTLTNPEITAESLEELLFRDKLGGLTTYYWGSTPERINNIDLVAKKLNGLVLMPGDEFSYNGYIGQRTEAAGFKAAAAYNDGKVVYEVGGGICQVSSTLYYAVMAANLETVERTCHYFAVGYMDKGLDATVSWPGPDFKFKNDRDYPIKIVAVSDHDSNALTIEIWGSNIDGTYVVPKSSWWPIYDATYPTVQTGWGGASYRYLYDKDGNLLDKIEEAGSVYHLHEEDIKWPDPEETTPPTDGGTEPGTGGEEPSPDPGGDGDDIVIVG